MTEPKQYGKVNPRNGQSQQPDLGQYVFGKVQPQAVPMEEAVLGALMLDREAFVTVCDILRPEFFYKDAHAAIFRAMQRLSAAYSPIDILTVTEQMRSTGELEMIGGGYYIVELTNRIASAANIEYHARIVAQKWMQRQMIKVCADAIKSAYEETEDIFALLGQHSKGILEISSPFQTKVAQTIGEATKAAYEQAQKAVQNEGLVGVPSGIVAVDRLTGGWRNGNLYIVAARPGMGKTAYVLTCAINAARDFGKKVLIFSPEMTNVQLGGRVIGAAAEVDGMVMNTGNASETELRRLYESLSAFENMPIWIDETPSPYIGDIRAKALRHKMKHGLDLVIIDYLQICEGDEGPREQEISSIARGSKHLAKELQVPVIALAQLSRAVETRGGAKRPQLSDLRESGSIEQEADLVGFLYRPEYYKIYEDEKGQSLKGIAEFIIEKHRGGALDTVKMRFEKEFTRFSELADEPFTPIKASRNFPTSDPHTPF